MLHELYLVDVQREDEPLANWWAEALVGLDEVACVLFDISDVEHVV